MIQIKNPQCLAFCAASNSSPSVPVFAGATRAQQTQTISDADLWEKFNALVIPKLDLQNATNARNEAFRYFDFRKGETVTRYQLGLIPNLSYRIEF